ncbi:MAG: hypothetical protein R6U84_07820 [Candidatus Cloacimonadales bacterium]
MRTKIIVSMILLIFLSKLISQNIAEDIINVNYEKKDARKAMLLSGILPGAGQFYADRSSLTAYIFPVIELGLWAGYIYYDQAGSDKDAEFEKYADEYYSREYYETTRDDLVGVYGDSDDYGAANNPVFYGYYDEEHGPGLFRLDEENTQHYYEDIGKYDKYIFGWQDWYEIYAADADGEFVGPNWDWEDPTVSNKKWVGMQSPTNPEHDDYLANQTFYDQAGGKYSSLRADYIDLRNESKDLYDMRRNFSFALAFNHIAAALDAVRVTRQRNMYYISSNQLKIEIFPALVNNNITPTLRISKRF